jgi:ATP-dependent DNA ligase
MNNLGQLCEKGHGVALVYYTFDLLSLEDKDLRKEALSTRGKLLAYVLKKAPPNIRLSEVCRVLKRTCSGWRKSLASRAWSRKD